MNKKLCPQCDKELEASAINVAKGIALCPNCGKLSQLNDVLARTRPTAEILQNIPGGCSIVDLGDKIVIEASLHSIGSLIGTICFCLFWNGIVSIFLIGTIGGFYINLVGPLPDWFPPPKMEGGGLMRLGDAIFFAILLIPFVVVGAGMIFGAFVFAKGRIKVEFGDTEGQVIRGIGFMSWHQRFDPREVSRVYFADLGEESATQSRYAIVIEADRTIKFGAMLKERRQQWLEAILRSIFVVEQTENHSPVLKRAREFILKTK